jgi:hypothetical protein
LDRWSLEGGVGEVAQDHSAVLAHLRGVRVTLATVIASTTLGGAYHSGDSHRVSVR